jgi:hypothetical protein
MQVLKIDFPKTDPVSGQAVALGGRPLKRRTRLPGREGETTLSDEFFPA